MVLVDEIEAIMHVVKGQLKLSWWHWYAHLTIFLVELNTTSIVFLQLHGVTRHTPCTHCRTWVYPNQGNARYHTDPAVWELSNTARLRHVPLWICLRLVRFPAPCNPHIQSPQLTPETRAIQVHDRSTVMHRPYNTCS